MRKAKPWAVYVTPPSGVDKSMGTRVHFEPDGEDACWEIAKHPPRPAPRSENEQIVHDMLKDQSPTPAHPGPFRANRRRSLTEKCWYVDIVTDERWGKLALIADDLTQVEAEEMANLLNFAARVARASYFDNPEQHAEELRALALEMKREHDTARADLAACVEALRRLRKDYYRDMTVGDRADVDALLARVGGERGNLHA